MLHQSPQDIHIDEDRRSFEIRWLVIFCVTLLLQKVQVQIRTELGDSQPALTETLVPVFKHPMGPTISLPYESSVGSMMQASAHKIEFPITKVGEQSGKRRKTWIPGRSHTDMTLWYYSFSLCSSKKQSHEVNIMVILMISYIYRHILSKNMNMKSLLGDYTSFNAICHIFNIGIL